jgi:hypothetical protein
MTTRFLLALALWASGGLGAMADCAAPATVKLPIANGLQPLSRVKDYRVVLKTCHRDKDKRLAIREMKVDGDDLLLTVDPQRLDTQLERKDCWSCDDTTQPQQASTRFMDAVNRFSQQPGKATAGWLANAGMTHGHDDNGVFVTGDLCPSRKPLDRAFLQQLEQRGATTPVALSVSGLWIKQHPDDFAWLRREKAEGRLAITFVNHSFHHAYQAGLAEGQNFLLTPGVDMKEEILDVERLLIANGETPSVFFRFPGLISSPALMTTLRENHLIPLGTNAWLALNPNRKASAGAIVLVHPNGNEPFGLHLFETQQDKLPKPFRSINEAP